MLTLRPEERIKNLLERRDFGSHVTVRGWVRTRRDSKGAFSFIEVNDGSSLKGIQVIADRSLPNYKSEVGKLTTGCCVRIEGELSTYRISLGSLDEVINLTLHLLKSYDPGQSQRIEGTG